MNFHFVQDADIVNIDIPDLNIKAGCGIFFTTHKGNPYQMVFKPGEFSSDDEISIEPHFITIKDALDKRYDENEYQEILLHKETVKQECLEMVLHDSKDIQ